MSGVEPYRLLDSGDGARLEQVGPYRVVRQAATAWWRPRLDRRAWEDVHAVHHRSERGGGHWEPRRPLPESWLVAHGGLVFNARLTPFGHLGLFAEHAGQWGWLREATPPGARVLNLFAYTGGATLAAAAAGAAVCHVDASRGVVDLARQNAASNGLAEAGIRWIVDDVPGFVARELRRGNRYQGIILDPPSFGRGARKEVWKVEEHLLPLLDQLRQILEPGPGFVLLSCHSPGFSGLGLANLLDALLDDRGGQTESGEMWTPQVDGRPLPSGAFARRRWG